MHGVESLHVARKTRVKYSRGAFFGPTGSLMSFSGSRPLASRNVLQIKNIFLHRLYSIQNREKM